RVGKDRRVRVTLPVHRRTPDVLVAGGPAAHHVPRGLVAGVVGALHLDLDPGAARRLGVPRRDQLAGVEPDVPLRRGPGGVVPAAGDAGVRVRVVGRPLWTQDG